MAHNPRKLGKTESDESLNVDEEPKNQSVLAPPPMKQRKTSFAMPFAMKKAARAPKFRHKNKILTKKQVEKLNSMEPHQIARSHNFKELEYIVDSLTRLYAQLYKYRDEIKLAKQEDAQAAIPTTSSGISKKKTEKEGKRRKSRKRFTLGRKSLKRGTSAQGNGRRGSVLNMIGKKNPNSDAKPLLSPAKTGGTTLKVSQNGSKQGTRNRKSGRRGGTRRGSVLTNAVARVRTSALRSSVPNFAKLASRIKNITSNPEDDLPVEKLKEYSSFAVENALEKSDRALKAHQRFKEMEKQRWKVWEEKEDEANTDCLIEMQGYIPTDLRFLNESQIAERLEGNIYLARRFNRHKVFLLFNMTFDQLQSVHPADLKNRYHIGGLDLVELRALYAHTAGIKRPWRYKLRQKLYIQLEKDAKGQLTEREQRHPAYENKPDFQEERKPSVVAFMNNRTNEGKPDKRAPSLVAMELQKRIGAPVKELSEIERKPDHEKQPRKIKISKKKPEDKEVEAIKSIYLVKRSPDAPVDRNLLTASRRKVDSVNKRGHRDTSDGDEKKRRPKDNIFSAFDDVKNSTVNDSRRRKNRPLAHGEKRIEDVEDEKGPDPELESYFADRDAEEDEEEEEDPKEQDFDEDKYKVKPDDKPQDLKRKQSELFIKAFEMINSDEVGDNDEVFLKTLRSLSVFTASMSGDELDEELERYAGDESESEDPDTKRTNNFYLSSPPQRPASERSIPESAYTEDEFL